MISLQRNIVRQLRSDYKGTKISTPPLWLSRSRWKPSFCMSLPNDPRIIVIDLIPSANIPRLIYREEVQKLIANHRNIRVIVCVLESQLDSFPETEDFCRKLGCGLQAFIPEVGLQIIIATDLDRSDRIDIPIEVGWFPHSIISAAQNLTNLAFHDMINEFCREVVVLANDESAVSDLVKKTVDRLLQHYPQCHAEAGSFMKLVHFESLFRQVVPDTTEHVLHSFRVFLTGCAVINRFYTAFRSACKRYCLGSEDKMSIEYAWLLTAIFHDIGRPLECGGRMLETEYGDEDIEVSVVGKNTRWIKDEYSQARRILVSLAMFIASNPAGSDEWDMGAVPDAHDHALAAEWTDLYDRMKSHAVISAFNMLASIWVGAAAVDERMNRPFVVTHAVPAALAILLHDWRIWDNAREWNLFPVDCRMIPMAALLIFIDTWDDFKRKGENSPINIKEFTISDTRVEITVQWSKAEEYEKEKIKYGAFKKALKNHLFDMRIQVEVAGKREYPSC